MNYADASLFLSLKIIGKFKSGFILVEHGNVAYIVDQHAADERVWLEKICIKKNILKSTEEDKLIACMKAVKLTDELDECAQEKIIHALSNCSFPFICAHGRPTIISINARQIN